MKRVHLSIPPPLETRAWDRQRQLFHRISPVMCGAFDDFVSRIIRGMRMFSRCIFKNVRGNERRWFKAGSTPCTNAPPLLVLPTQLSSLDALLLLHYPLLSVSPLPSSAHPTSHHRHPHQHLQPKTTQPNTHTPRITASFPTITCSNPLPHPDACQRSHGKREHAVSNVAGRRARRAEGG